MNELMTAKEAKAMTESVRADKKLNELVSKTAKAIKKEVLAGNDRLFIEDKDWHKGYGSKYKTINEQLKANGYSIEPHVQQFAPNGGRPDDFDGVLIKWS